MAARDTSTSPSSCDSPDFSQADQENKQLISVVSIGCNYQYTIPSFPVITVELRLATIQTVDDGVLKLADVFLREKDLLNTHTPVPLMVEVLKACFVDVSNYTNRHGISLWPYCSLGLCNISIFSNTKVSVFKGIYNILILLIPLYRIPQYHQVISKNASLNKSILQLPQ